MREPCCQFAHFPEFDWVHTDGMAFSEAGFTDVSSYQEENICKGSYITLIQTPWNMTPTQGTSPERLSVWARVLVLPFSNHIGGALQPYPW